MSTSSLRTSLSRNVGLWVVGLAILGLVGVVVYTYLAYRRAATDLVLERDEQLTVVSAARLQGDLADYGDLLIILARRGEMSGGFVSSQMVALEEAAPRLAVFDGGVVVLDTHGRVRATLPEQPRLTGTDCSNRDFFQDILSGSEMAFSDSQVLYPNGPLIIAVAVPIRDEGNAFVGAMAGLFRLGEPTLSSFYASIVRLRLGQSGTTYVVDGIGRVLFDSESSRVGRFLSTDQLSLATSATSGSLLTEDISGNDVVAAHAPVPGTRWTLIAEDDWSVVTTTTGRYRDILLLSFAAALLLPPLGLSLVSRQRRFRFLDIRRPEQDESWVKTVRERLTPAQLPVLAGWNLHAYQMVGTRSEHEFFDAYLRPDGRLMLALGRVSATGIQGALALAAARTTLRNSGLQLMSPVDTLQQVNQMLCMQHASSLALRGLVLVVDPTTGWMEYAVAGVAPPRSSGHYLLQEPSAGGQPLGLRTELQAETGRILIEPGCVCALLGPSMLEARNFEGQPFVPAVLQPILGEHVAGQQEQAEKIFDGFKTFNARSPFFPPDMTVLLLERLAPGGTG